MDTTLILATVLVFSVLLLAFSMITAQEVIFLFLFLFD